MSKDLTVPKLRFPEFKGEWKSKKLGDVAKFKVTNSFSRDNLNYENGSVKNIHYGDIHTKFQTLFDITKEFVPFINEEVSINRISDDFYCKEGDIIFADASEDLNDVGKSIEITNLNNEKLLSGLHTLLARPIENTFKIGFNGYLFKSNTVRLQIQKESQGSKVLSINVGRISGIEISFPTLPEQQKISNFLTTIDEKLQVLKQKKTLLEKYKKGVIQQIFSQELRFKDDNGNDFLDWKHEKITDIAKTSIGLVTTMTTSYAEVGIPLIRNSDIKENQINKSKLIYLNENFAFKHKHKQFSLGDIVTVHTGEIGVSAVIDDSMVGSLGFATLNTRVNKKIALPEFVCLYYNTSIYINYAISMSTGDGRSNYNLKDFDKAIIPIPSLDEQKKIADFIIAIYDKINHCQLEIEKTEIWKKGLMQQMFV